MTGYARQGIDMKRCLGQPFGMIRDGLSMVVTPGALDVYVTAGYSQQRLYGMRVVAVSASGIFAVQALIVFLKDRTVAFLAGGSRWPDPVIRVTFRDPVVAGWTADPGMCR